MILITRWLLASIAQTKTNLATNRNLSSYYNPVMIENGKTNKSGNSIIKPSIVKHYSTHMGSVDRVDQQLHGIQVL